MQSATNSRPARFAGRILAVAFLLFGAPVAIGVENAGDDLQHADQIKYTHNDEFQALLKQLDARASDLTSLQRDWLEYFHAWQLGYRGDYQNALAAFQALLAHTQDKTLRARSRISLIYDQVNAAHFEDAYTTVGDLLDSLPQIADHNAQFLVLITAAYVYTGGGQHDLALKYVDQALAFDQSARSTCIALVTRIEALYAANRAHSDGKEFQQGIDACQRAGDSLYANNIRRYAALLLVAEGHPSDALTLLRAHDAEVLATHSATTISEFHSALARSYFATGDLGAAKVAALSAIEYANSQVNARSVAAAYDVLYQVAKRQSDDKAALAWHEKFATTDKGYLNDISARALAFQMVHQQVLDKKRELDALAEQNKLLQLQGEIDTKTAQNRLLTIALLVVGLCAIALWAYRVKRSQLKFQKLARRDGLTGIHNRQHFFETAQDALRYCAKSSREASLLVLDLDHFKEVNDMHGHAAGDAVLKRAVIACQSRLRSIDLFGRLGGEEFAILLPDCGETTAAERADEMRAAIASARRSEDVDVQVTASFGVAATRVCGYNLPTLLAKADEALYVAKNAGRNRVATFQAESASRAANPSAA